MRDSYHRIKQRQENRDAETVPIHKEKLRTFGAAAKNSALRGGRSGRGARGRGGSGRGGPGRGGSAGGSTQDSLLASLAVVESSTEEGLQPDENDLSNDVSSSREGSAVEEKETGEIDEENGVVEEKKPVGSRKVDGGVEAKTGSSYQHMNPCYEPASGRKDNLEEKSGVHDDKDEDGGDDEDEDPASRQTNSTPTRRRSSIGALVNKGKSIATAMTTNTTAASTSTTLSNREGFMEKRGGGTSQLGSRSWRKRYFVLKDRRLTYYHKPDDHSNGKGPLKGAVFAINMCQVREEIQTPLTFSIVPKTADAGPRVLHCRCSTQKETSAWVASLRACETPA